MIKPMSIVFLGSLLFFNVFADETPVAKACRLSKEFCFLEMKNGVIKPFSDSSIYDLSKLSTQTKGDLEIFEAPMKEDLLGKKSKSIVEIQYDNIKSKDKKIIGMKIYSGGYDPASPVNRELDHDFNFVDIKFENDQVDSAYYTTSRGHRVVQKAVSSKICSQAKSLLDEFEKYKQCLGDFEQKYKNLNEIIGKSVLAENENMKKFLRDASLSVPLGDPGVGMSPAFKLSSSFDWVDTVKIGTLLSECSSSEILK